jgi:hypothetical protein
MGTGHLKFKKLIGQVLSGPWVKFAFYMSGILSIGLLIAGIHDGFRTAANLDGLNVVTLKVAFLKRDSVWVKGRRGRKGGWRRLLEVHFSDRPIYLSYGNHRLFADNCWKIYRDSSLTIWHKEAPAPSEKYRMKNVIEGGQVEQMRMGSVSIYTQQELQAARKESAAGLYRISGVFGAVSLILVPAVFRRKKASDDAIRLQGDASRSRRGERRSKGRY